MCERDNWNFIINVANDFNSILFCTIFLQHFLETTSSYKIGMSCLNSALISQMNILFSLFFIIHGHSLKCIEILKLKY